MISMDQHESIIMTANGQPDHDYQRQGLLDVQMVVDSCSSPLNGVLTSDSGDGSVTESDMISMITSDEVQMMVDRVLEESGHLSSPASLSSSPLPVQSVASSLTSQEDQGGRHSSFSSGNGMEGETSTAIHITSGIINKHNNNNNCNGYNETQTEGSDGNRDEQTAKSREPVKKQKNASRFSTRNYYELPISMKVQLIQEYDKGLSQRSLSKKYKIARATVNQTIKNRDKYVTEFDKMTRMAELSIKTSQRDAKLTTKANKPLECLKLRRVRKTCMTNLNEVLEQYVQKSLLNDEYLSGPKLKSKAMEVAKEMGLNGFKASNGWLDSFKKRCSLDFGSAPKAVPVDTSEAYEKMTAECLQRIDSSRKRRISQRDCDLNGEETGPQIKRSKEKNTGILAVTAKPDIIVTLEEESTGTPTATSITAPLASSPTVIIAASSDDDDVLSPGDETGHLTSLTPVSSLTDTTDLTSSWVVDFSPVSAEEQLQQRQMDIWNHEPNNGSASSQLFQLQVSNEAFNLNGRQADHHEHHSTSTAALNASNTALIKCEQQLQQQVVLNLQGSQRRTDSNNNNLNVNNTANLSLMHNNNNSCLDSRIEVPAISCVREAIDILERFSLTKMPTLLTNVLNIRQAVGNFVIHQQHQQQHFQDQTSHPTGPGVQSSGNLIPQQTSPTSILMNNLMN